MDWKLIETAPKDGRWVYTWGPQEGHGIARFNVHGDGWERSTHWMPLPDPPVKAQPLP